MKQYLLNTTSRRALMFNLAYDDKLMEILIRNAAILAVKDWRIER